MPSLLAMLVLLAAEPSLVEVQAAAARRAAGEAAEDASRTSRARNAHWAPVLRGQGQLNDAEKTRRGEARLAPINEDDNQVGHAWTVALQWDFSQVIYAREESQLALAHAHLARLRAEAAEKAAQLFVERVRLRRVAALAPRSVDAQCELLKVTAALEALTGLFRDALSREEAACAAGDKQ